MFTYGIATEPQQYTGPPPEPQSSGVQGAQASPPSEAVTLVPASDWKAQQSLSESIKNVHDGRRLAAGAFLTVTSASVRMLEDELTAAREDRRASDRRERETLERYYDEKQRAAVADTQSMAAGENSRLRSIMQNVGSVLMGAAITLYLTPSAVSPQPSGSTILNNVGFAAAFGIVGAVLLLATLFIGRSGSAKK